MMNHNQPKLLPLYLTTIGSVLLAIPGSFGTLFLIDEAIRPLNGKFDNVILFLPVALIGYFLLFGYFWTVRIKRFIKWFWVISAIFNLLLTFVSGYFILEMNFRTINFNNQSDALSRLSFLLFPIWTLFVTISSVKYAFYKPTDKVLNLP